MFNAPFVSSSLVYNVVIDVVEGPVGWINVALYKNSMFSSQIL